jgi:hypothetical protein
MLRNDYYAAMDWDVSTGRLSKQRADQLGLSEILGEYVSA